MTQAHASIPVFVIILLYPNRFEQFLLVVNPSLLVFETCGLTGYLLLSPTHFGFVTSGNSLAAGDCHLRL